MLRGRAAMFDFPNHPSADSFAVNSGQRHGQQCVQRTGYGWLEWRTFVLPRRLGKGQVVRIRPRRPTPPPLLAVGGPGVQPDYFEATPDCTFGDALLCLLLDGSGLLNPGVAALVKQAL